MRLVYVDELWRSLPRGGVVLGKLSTRVRGLLHAAIPADCGVPRMRVCWPEKIPLVFHPDHLGRNITVRVGHRLPYGLIIGA